jgi:hypothetical protein
MFKRIYKFSVVIEIAAAQNAILPPVHQLK